MSQAIETNSSHWNKVPVMIKSIVTGFLVSTIGIALWTADITIFGITPWSIVLMLVPLWLYWKFFNGYSWPKSNIESRRINFRNVHSSRKIWIWGLLGGLLFVAIIQASFVITFRLIPLPDSFSSQYPIIETLPTSVAWMAIFMSSLVAGICEETGFRGYMQVPLEKRYGPMVAIVVVSIVFCLIHLDRSWALSVIPVIFCASVLLGILAYKTQSLIFGIIGHTILDVFDYSFWWTKILGKFEWETVFVSGIDMHFILWCLIFVTAVTGFFVSMFRVSSIRHAYAKNA
jgi:membrane protease YdiL (CAAX protease family)